MEKKLELFTVWTDETRNIVYSRGSGVARAHQIAELYENIADMARNFPEGEPWAYMAFIEELQQVSPKGSSQYVELHKTLEAAGCKYIAYIEGNSYEVSVQSYKHKQLSHTPGTINKYFATMQEGLDWFAENNI